MADHSHGSRRSFLQQSAVGLGVAALAAPFQALLSRIATGAPLRGTGYGELFPTADERTGLELIKLPRGFRYTSYGWTGDLMSDGLPTPAAHDGMSVIASQFGRVVLCRNHELNGDGTACGVAAITFDPLAPAGTTNLIFNTRSGRFEKSWASLGGTSRNCAGGPTPWGSWLSCEETVQGPGDAYGPAAEQRSLTHEQPHGWVFEVPAFSQAVPLPIRDMGRFVHEAVAVDPRTSIVYETEDQQTSGLYRFIPHQQRLLHLGGRLQMLQVVGQEDLRRDVDPLAVYQTEWVDIPDPTLAHTPGTQDGLGVYQQGKSSGGTTFARLEGCWYQDGIVYFVSTNGGNARQGQIWAYNPVTERLWLIYESPGRETLAMPDNMCVSPRGGIVLAEDGDWPKQRLQGLTLSGDLFPLAENNTVLDGRYGNFAGDYSGTEWAGVSFSPDGRWLFANLQTPGITLAITGPWEQGAL